MDISKVFKTFVGEIRKRTNIMTEDNIRYYWFASMLTQDKELNNYTLEYPYINEPELIGKELDLLYKGPQAHLCFEMKFHRNSKDTAYPQTDAAGAIFSDINRLPFFQTGDDSKAGQEIIRYFLYVTDATMDSYLSQTKSLSEYREGLQKFYTANIGESFSIIYPEDTPITFFKKLRRFNNTETSSPKITLVEKEDFRCDSNSFKDNECHIRLYRIGE
ncbi:MAG: hypothetical protein D8B41_03175 [Porphyromonas sp.]|nr:MAG: hypothetical protein D8B41_03175 [Porphyromonas sp.]